METPAETSERLRHASSFGAVAAAYADHRPSYADDAIRWCLAPLTASPARVADVGAGTGILTAALVRLGADVTAVEPDPDMLAEFRRRLPSVPSASGRAEELPFPDASLDAVVAAQAMHWFDMPRAMVEIARVLAPGGVFAGLWNVDDDRVGWVEGLSQASHRKASITMRRWRESAAARRQELTAATAALFEPAESAEFPNGQRHTADSLIATIATHSHVLVMDESERSVLLAQAAGFLADQPETSVGEFILPMFTVAIRTVRQPLRPA
jgi:SAM-dependent methyltransferase